MNDSNFKYKEPKILKIKPGHYGSIGKEEAKKIDSALKEEFKRSECFMKLRADFCTNHPGYWFNTSTLDAVVSVIIGFILLYMGYYWAMLVPGLILLISIGINIISDSSQSGSNKCKENKHSCKLYGYPNSPTRITVYF